jgi:hypothetical protein
MFKTVKRLQSRLVGAGADGFWKAAPWVFLFLGLALFGVAHFFVDAKIDPSWNSFFLGVGSLLISAGVFAVLLKSFQYIKVFRDELLQVFADESFQQRLESIVRPTPSSVVELRGLVEPLVERFAKNRTASLSTGAIIELRQLLDIFDQDGFYRHFSRTIKILSYDATSRNLKIDDELFIELVPVDPASEISHRSSVTSQDSTFSNGTLEVNGQDYSNKIKVDGHTVVYELQLAGLPSYRIRRQYRKTLDLKSDPYLNLRLTRPALNVDLRVENVVPSAINVIVRGVGFDTLNPSAKYDVTTSEKCDGAKVVQLTRLNKQSLTLPDNGYFVIFGVR